MRTAVAFLIRAFMVFSLLTVRNLLCAFLIKICKEYTRVWTNLSNNTVLLLLESHYQSLVCVNSNKCHSFVRLDTTRQVYQRTEFWGKVGARLVGRWWLVSGSDRHPVLLKICQHKLRVRDASTNIGDGQFWESRVGSDR